MTDRELLELAAKAAGMDNWLWSTESAALCHFDRHMCSWYRNQDHERIEWNPLTNDGDCARLEAALLIELLWHEGGVQAGRRVDSFAVYEDFGSKDRNAVRRRVSVEVAAEIGKAMP